jgi:integrase
MAVKNPARGIRINRQIPASEKRVILSLEEQEAFLIEAQKSFFYNAYVVQLNTGVRAGELFALTEEVLDFENKIIRIDKSLQFKCFEGKGEVLIGRPKTPSSNRVIPMNTACEEALYSQIKLKDKLNEK